MIIATIVIEYTPDKGVLTQLNAHSTHEYEIERKLFQALKIFISSPNGIANGLGLNLQDVGDEPIFSTETIVKKA